MDEETETKKCMVCVVGGKNDVWCSRVLTPDGYVRLRSGRQQPVEVAVGPIEECPIRTGVVS